MEHWNKRVAQNRGEKWRKNLLIGRMEVNKNPTILRCDRLIQGKSQAEIAKSINVTLSTYGAIESGRRPVLYERAKAISDYLGSSISRIFKKIDDNKYLAKK